MAETGGSSTSHATFQYGDLHRSRLHHWDPVQEPLDPAYCTRTPKASTRPLGQSLSSPSMEPHKLLWASFGWSTDRSVRGRRGSAGDLSAEFPTNAQQDDVRKSADVEF